LQLEEIGDVLLKSICGEMRARFGVDQLRVDPRSIPVALHRSFERVTDASSFHPSSLDDAPMMAVDGGIDQIAAQPPQPRQCAILVSGRETAVTDGVRIGGLLPFAGTTSLLASPTCE
jgi:hypothetical protein